MSTLRVVVRGRVQGVGFRHFVWSRARALQVRGRVWNRRDGAVEVEAEAGRAALEQLLEQVRRGPSGARVESLDETWDGDAPGNEGFKIVG